MSRAGSRDAILDLMKSNGIPLTRENYLDLAYMGNVPEITAEIEAEIPDEIKNARSKGVLSSS